MNNRALVIHSGGQDSSTCLFWAKKMFKEVQAIIFEYGQKNKVEVECAIQLCIKEKIRFIIVDMSFLSSLSNSAFVTNGEVNAKNNKGYSDAFVPNRNQLFITLAHTYAQMLGYDNIVTGISQEGESGFPDCRSSFVKILEANTNTGSNSNIKIHTPVMFRNKGEIFALAKDLGCLDIIIKETHTCYEGNRDILHEWGYGCGRCLACKGRKKGYNEFLKF